MDQRDFRRNVLICLALAVGTAALYTPAAGFSFVHYDDNIYLQDNYHINRGLSLPALAWCWQAGYASNWHPLTWLSHALDCQLYGLNPRGHHLTNIALHVLNSVLVFLVLRRMTGATWRSAMVAALFAWHPMHVESVAWVAERKDVLSTFFWLLTLWAYARYAENLKSQRPNCKCFYFAALAFFALALMSKPMVVTLPFVLLLLDWWPLQRFQSSATAPGAFSRTFWRLVVEKIPFMQLSAVCCVLTVIAQHRGGTIQSLQVNPLNLRVYNALLSYVRYIGKLFLPVNLTVIYPQGPPPALSHAVVSGCVLVAVSALAVMSRRRRPYESVGWFWFLGTLVPVIGLVQVGVQTMADRYTYVPFLGLFIILCWRAYDLAGNWPHSRTALGLVAAMTLGGCAWATSKQLQYWRNTGALFQHAATVTLDNYVARARYAGHLADIGDWERARQECEKSLQINPDFPLARTVLGVVLYREGKFDEAARQLKIALRLHPDSPTAGHFLGETLLEQNLPNEAVPLFSKELETNPANPGAHCGLGKALARQGKLDEARKEFQEALRLVFAYSEAHYELAAVLAAQQETTNAISHYRLALHFRPNYPEALNNLAWILASDPRAEIRRGDEAVKLATQACELTHYQLPLELGTLAAAEAEAGRFDDAVAQAQKAHDVALALGREDVAARCLELRELFRSHRPYRSPP